jgi:L-ascorbate 6-phosphate lactonase
MKNFAKIIKETRVEPGSLAIFWIAQAGFVFKTPGGKVIYTDPYLTDYAQRTLPEYGYGFKRIMATLIEPEEVDADYVISTHSHADHFDADAMPILAKNSRIHFIGAPDCQELYIKADIKHDRFTILHQAETLELEGFKLSGVYADHSDLALEALGLWFEFDGIKVWQVGDSAYRPGKWQDLFEQYVDVLILPINGAYGNMNEVEAAKLARDSHACMVIPCHFWMFPLHFGNPADFLEACKRYAPEVMPLLMTQGELFLYHKE